MAIFDDIIFGLIFALFGISLLSLFKARGLIYRAQGLIFEFFESPARPEAQKSMPDKARSPKNSGPTNH